MFTEPSGGMEELLELTQQADSHGGPLAKRARRVLSPSLVKWAGLASIPLSAALGFGLVPSRRMAAHAAGALVTGLASAVGKSRLDTAMTEQGAKPALAQALLDVGIENVEEAKEAVAAVQDSFGLAEEDYMTLAVHVYATYLQGMVKYRPTAKTSELKELERLRTVLRLDNLAVGEAHALAAQEWYRTVTLFSSPSELNDRDDGTDDDTHPDRQAMDKMLFLTERALRSGKETEEAFTFEMTRVAKALHVPDLPTAMDRVAATVEPFYQRALQSTRAKLETQQVSADMLERARKTLGVAEETAFDMHVAAFNEEVRVSLGLPEKKTDRSIDEEDVEDFSDEDGAVKPQDLGMASSPNLKFSPGSVERVSSFFSLS
jgi:hypothetical protein